MSVGFSMCPIGMASLRCAERSPKESEYGNADGATRLAMADHGRLMHCISFTAQLGRTWKCRAVGCVYSLVVCGVISTDL
jgi:hypothetical protein